MYVASSTSFLLPASRSWNGIPPNGQQALEYAVNLNKPQRISAVSATGTLLAGVGAAVGAADWKFGLYGLLGSVLAGVSGVLWPLKATTPFFLSEPKPLSAPDSEPPATQVG